MTLVHHKPHTKFVPSLLWAWNSNFEQKWQVYLMVVMEKISNIIALVLRLLKSLDYIHRHICKPLIPQARPRNLWNKRIKFKNPRKKVKTVFNLPVQFKHFFCSKHVPNSPRNLLPSRTSLRPSGIASIQSHGSSFFS